VTELTDTIAREARDIALRVSDKLTEREKLHDERHDALRLSVLEIKNMLKWVGGVLITLILSVLGWSLVQQYNANEAQLKSVKDQVTVLEAARALPPAALVP
jgi:hypothetical protein